MPKLPSSMIEARQNAIGRPEVLLERAHKAVLEGRHDDAMRLYQRVHAIDPTNVALSNGLGALLASSGELENAVNWYDNSLRLDPDQPLTWLKRGHVLANMGRLEDALSCFDRMISLRPDQPAGYAHRAMTLYRLGKFRDALAVYDILPRATPNDAPLASNRGAAAQWCGDYEAAFRDFDRAAALDPTMDHAFVNKAILMMLLGDLPNGLRLYDQRWRLSHDVVRRTLTTPAWKGASDIRGKTLFIYWEQGLGDTINFCRYATMAANAGALVILEVQKPLVTLMTTLPGVSQVIASGEPTPDHDLHCALLTLPLAFGTTIETIPAEVPYLRADPSLVAHWRDRLIELQGRRIGLVWAGSSGIGDAELVGRDQRRSLPLSALAPLLSATGCSFVSLQFGDATAKTAPGGMILHDHTGELNNFADTAALIENLDLVISVDTSTAHLAGAMGKPVWLLNRFDTDWRWFLDRDDSPWYPTMRIFRQPQPGDWTSVVQSVAQALRAFVAV